MKNKALGIAGIIFLLVAVVHLSRLFYPFEVVFGDYHVPVWVSGIGFVIAGLLSSLMFYSLGAKENT